MSSRSRFLPLVAFYAPLGRNKRIGTCLHCGKRADMIGLAIRALARRVSIRHHRRQCRL